MKGIVAQLDIIESMLGSGISERLIGALERRKLSFSCSKRSYPWSLMKVTKIEDGVLLYYGAVAVLWYWGKDSKWRHLRLSYRHIHTLQRSVSAVHTKTECCMCLLSPFFFFVSSIICLSKDFLQSFNWSSRVNKCLMKLRHESLSSGD